MKNLYSCACAALLACVFVPSCLAAADSPWTGTWKMNMDKSKLTGDTYVITQMPGGMMHYTSGSAMSYDFACDGQPHSTLADRTMTCTGSPEAGYDYSYKAGETMLGMSHKAFSADGKMLTTKGTSMNADGSKTDYEETYKRETATKGLVGKWMDVKVTTTVGSMIYTVEGGSIKVEDPKAKLVFSCNLDGAFAPVTGPNIPEGAMASYKAEGPMKLHYVNKYKDKVLEEGTQTLSADGKTMTEESWEAGKINEKATLIWEKQ